MLLCAYERKLITLLMFCRIEEVRFARTISGSYQNLFLPDQQEFALIIKKFFYLIWKKRFCAESQSLTLGIFQCLL